MLIFSAKQASSQNPDSVHFQGIIYDTTHTPVPFAHIIISGSGTGTASNVSGYFHLIIRNGDTLIFSATGYKKQSVIVNNTDKKSVINQKVILRQDTIYLSEAIVYPWPANFELLKKDFLSLEIPDNFYIPEINIPSVSKADIYNGNGYAGITMQGPVSLLYNAFSKKAKSERKYRELTGQDMKNAMVSVRYSIDLIKKLTKLESEEKIKDFIAFCGLEDHFILNATEYELYLAIIKCYQEYNIPSDSNE